MGKPKVTLYVDIISPFAYLGYYMVRHSPVFQQVQVTYTPILLGGLFKACGNRPPLDIKNKDRWIDRERTRWASQFKIPIADKVPEGFPVSTVNTQRALCALDIATSGNQEVLVKALDALYQSFWVERNHLIGKPETFLPILEKAVGKDLAEKIKQELGTAETKKRLSENTDRAFNQGAFGLPWFECENSVGEKDSFWGFDHVGQVVRFLELQPEKGELRSLL